ncbi:hypothetical protein [Sinorhizobium medicae]
MAALRQIAFHGKGIGMSKQKRKPKLVTASTEVNPTQRAGCQKRRLP